VDSDFSISGVRRRIHTGLPRHSTVSSWPGSILLISTSTGAPAALARALGIMLRTKGVAAKAAPTTPNPLVITSNRRRRGLTPSSLM
jgi:hypothetical protein